MRQALAAAAALAAVVLAAGCGGSTLDPVAKAAAKTSDAGSYRFAYTAALAGASMKGSGAYDAADERAQMGFELSGAQVPAGMTMDLVTDLSAGGVVYLRMPLVSAFLPEGKSWIRVDLAKAAAQEGVDLTQVTQALQVDPSQTLELLKEVGSSQELGHEQVGGADTTHYRVTLDAQKLVDREPTEAAKQALRKALADADLTSYPVDVWVDGDGYLRRLQLSLPQAAGKLQLTEELTAFGSDVTVDLPSADAVVDASSGSLGG